MRYIQQVHPAIWERIRLPEVADWQSGYALSLFLYKHTSFVKQLRSKTVLFSQQTQQQVLGSDEFVGKQVSLLSGMGQDTLALSAQREIDRDRNLLPDGGVPLDLLAD